MTSYSCNGRDKEHSTIIYESSKPELPLLRLGWNKQDPRYMATILMDSSQVVVLDIRSAVCKIWLCIYMMLANNILPHHKSLNLFSGTSISLMC